MLTFKAFYRDLSETGTQSLKVETIEIPDVERFPKAAATAHFEDGHDRKKIKTIFIGNVSMFEHKPTLGERLAVENDLAVLIFARLKLAADSEYLSADEIEEFFGITRGVVLALEKLLSMGLVTVGTFADVPVWTITDTGRRTSV